VVDGVAVSDRRTVTVVFADLSGFTKVADRLDPEDVSTLLHETVGGLVEEVHELDGWVEKQAGDAILAVFGAPVAHEDDAVRAICAALAMRDRIAAMRDDLERRFGHRFTVHVGVNTGLVVMRPRLELFKAGDGDFIVVGDTVNTGARLYQAAAPDQILVGEQTYQSTRALFDFRAIEPVDADGKHERVPAYECLGLRRSATPWAVAAPLVGRNAEVTRIHDALATLRAGEGSILVISGEPGIGKTRLVRELRREATGIRTIETRLSPLVRTFGYQPFRDLFAQLAGGETWKDLESWLTGLSPDQLAETLPYLAVLRGVPGPDEVDPQSRLDADALRQQVFRATRLVLERTTLKEPLVVILEDWHWADDSSGALLEHLMPLVEFFPLLICCTTRPEPDTPGGRLARRPDAIELEPLTPLETAELAVELAGDAGMSGAWRAALYSSSGGNPFYIEELVRAVADTGRWDGTIPDSVQGVIAARIDRLDPVAREVLRVAAVVGRRFDPETVGALSGSHADIERVLPDLVERQLLARGPDGKLRFRHALTQETAYEGILLSRRRELHEAAAAHLEQTRGVEVAGTLAWHFARAERWDKAQRYLVIAGDQAGSIAADVEALELYRRAIEAYDRAFEDRWNPRERAELERKIGHALFRLGRHDEALESLYAALELLRCPYPRTRVGLRLAIAREALRQIGHRLLPRALLRAAPQPLPVAAERARIYGSIGWISYFMDFENYAHLALANLNSSERNRLPFASVTGAMGVGLVLDSFGLFRLAGRYHARSLRIAQLVGTPQTEAFARLGLGYRYECLGELDAAQAEYERGAFLARQAGELRQWGGLTFMLASVALLQGRVSDAETLSRAILRVGEETGDAAMRGWGRLWLARSAAARGEHEEGAALATEALPTLEAVSDNGGRVAALATLARCRLQLGDVDGALETLAQARSLVREHHLRGRMCVPLHDVLPAALIAAAARTSGRERRALLRRASRACRAARLHARIERQGLAAVYRNRADIEAARGRRWRAARLRERSDRIDAAVGSSSPA
jgi:class 3 adenylate cyclase/tetratricopeptide (TPR) repeat protein